MMGDGISWGGGPAVPPSLHKTFSSSQEKKQLKAINPDSLHLSSPLSLSFLPCPLQSPTGTTSWTLTSFTNSGSISDGGGVSPSCSVRIPPVLCPRAPTAPSASASSTQSQATPAFSLVNVSVYLNGVKLRLMLLEHLRAKV